MSQHVLARISGFGWTVLPYAPFQCEQVAERVLLVQHESKRARVSFESGRPEVEDGASIHDVADLIRGPNHDHWRIETTVFTIRWPTGFALWSSAQAPGFDLLGPHDTMIYLQGPVLAARVPEPEEMIGAGQTVLGHDRDWVELAYDHDGVAWRQKHRVAELEDYRVLVTAQGPAERFGPADAAAQEMALSLRRFQAESDS